MGTTRGIQRELRLDNDVHGGSVEGLEHDLSCLLCVVLCAVCCLLFVVFVVCCLLFVVCCLLFVVCCLLFVVC